MSPLILAQPKTSIIAKFFDFILKVANSFFKHWFYILWIIVVPLITMFMTQGHEMVESLLQRKDISLPLLIAVFTMIGFTLWAVPMPSIDITRWFAKVGGDKKYLHKKLIESYNAHDANSTLKSYLPIRYFSVLPLVMLSAGICYSGVHFDTSNRVTYYVTIAANLLFLPLFYWVFPKVFVFIAKRFAALNRNTQDYKKILLRVMWQNVVAYLIWVGAFLALALLIQDKGVYYRIIVSFLITLFACWQYMMLYYLECNTYAYTNEQLDKLFKGKVRNKEIVAELTHLQQQEIADASYAHGKRLYWLLIAQIVTGLILLLYANYAGLLSKLSPLLVLMFFFNFFLIVFDIFYKAPISILTAAKQGSTDDVKTAAYGVWITGLKIVGILFWAVIVWTESNKHRIRLDLASDKKYYAPSDRMNVSQYFALWDSTRKYKGKKLVFLVAGQGGGSRAASWIHKNLNYLDSNFVFSDHVFAYGAASGSIVGINFKLAEWRLAQLQGDATCVPYDDTALNDLYVRNYFTNSFYGILWGDMVDSWRNRLSFGDRIYDKDRNYTLQQEEVRGFTSVFRSKIAAKKHFVDSIERYHFLGDYLSFNYPKDNFVMENFSRHQPLFYINTTLAQRGDRCTFMPALPDTSSYYAYDIYNIIKSNSKLPTKPMQVNLPQITAVCQGQAVPVLNAMNYVQDFGNLCDGGVADNSGCGTLLDVYRELRKTLDTSYQIVVLYFQNSNDYRTTKVVENHKRAVDLALKGAINASLTSYAAYWPQKFELTTREMHARSYKDTFIRFTLNYEASVTRMLNDAVIDSINKEVVLPSNVNKLNYVKSLLHK
jgi:hypothetical protein